MPLSELNCVIVLDDSIKDKLKSNIYSLVVYKVYIINNIKELNKEILENTNKVVFLGTISYNQLNEIKMIKKILNLEYYFISDDKLLVNLFTFAMISSASITSVLDSVTIIGWKSLILIAIDTIWNEFCIIFHSSSRTFLISTSSLFTIPHIPIFPH